VPVYRFTRESLRKPASFTSALQDTVTASTPRLRIVIATMPGHHVPVNRFFPKLTTVLLCFAGLLLSSCAGRTPGEHIADMPHWMGGEPEGVPPRRGTPEYDAWMAARAQEAARPKTGQPKSDQPKTDPSKIDSSKADQAR